MPAVLPVMRAVAPEVTAARTKMPAVPSRMVAAPSNAGDVRLGLRAVSSDVLAAPSGVRAVPSGVRAVESRAPAIESGGPNKSPDQSDIRGRKVSNGPSPPPIQAPTLCNPCRELDIRGRPPRKAGSDPDNPPVASDSPPKSMYQELVREGSRSHTWRFSFGGGRHLAAGPFGGYFPWHRRPRTRRDR